MLYNKNIHALMFIVLFFFVISLHPRNVNKNEPPVEITNDTTIQYTPIEYSNSQSATECLAKNIYFEARGESMQGQLAVGLVTLNRVKNKQWPDTVCRVVYQSAQFSWYWDGKSDDPKDLDLYQNIYRIASALTDKDNAIYDFTKGSTHYHADYVNPIWAKHLTKITKIDTHIFYKK